MVVIQPLKLLPNSNAMFSQGLFSTLDKAYVPVERFHFLTLYFDFKVIKHYETSTI